MISIPTSCSGFQGTGAQLQTVLNGTPSGQTVYIACRAVVRVTSTLVIPAGVILATSNLPAPNHYAEMARLVRQSLFQEPIVRIKSGAQLRSVWVEGQRGTLGSDTSSNRLSINVQTFGGTGTVVSGNRVTDPTGWTNLHAPGTSDGLPCGGQTISGNLITGYATVHSSLPLVQADGLSVVCENTTVSGNSIIDVTDAGIVLFRATPAVQRSQVYSNTILNAGNSAYFGIVMDHQETHGADFTGAWAHDNVLWTGTHAHVDLGLTVGIRELAVYSGYGIGAAMTNNTSGGYPQFRTNTGIAIDGMFNTNVTGNNLATQLVPTGEPCTGGAVVASVSAGWATGAIQQPYIDAGLDGCVTGIHPNN